ncbi:RNA polymerase sigma factor [Flagellimonas meridianipacifica]|uniref:RNA polymerase sigma factor n=1 Tax=Flagellimonas meridianipacifica TaxID=1080225 RepID=UPI000D07E04D|nr:sigma-70 family RNA polymerase sigma factor [Allomuricauda pacifica]
MKIIALNNNEKAWIKRAVSGDSKAQQMLYDRYAGKMLSVCRQYVKDVQFAEDVMVHAFVKVFKNLNSFEYRGSFEGWIRKIMVRESISYLRKRQFVVYDDGVLENQEKVLDSAYSAFDVEYIQNQIDQLPEGYKMVFLLFAIEGYKHHEIAEMLQISEGTSKSQLFKARKMLQENLKWMMKSTGRN